MEISSKDVVRIARLAKLKVDESLHQTYVQELKDIFAVLDQLSDVNTEGLSPMVTVNSNTTPLRRDKITDGDCEDKILANAPLKKYGYFLVPKVVE